MHDQEESRGDGSDRMPSLFALDDTVLDHLTRNAACKQTSPGMGSGAV